MLSRLIGHFISLVIMPSQTKPKIYDIEPREQEGFSFKTDFVPSTNGALINFCEIKPKNAQNKKKKVIIYGCGRDDNFENNYVEYFSVAKKISRRHGRRF